MTSVVGGFTREHAAEENPAMIKGSREMRLPFLFMSIYYFWLDSLRKLVVY